MAYIIRNMRPEEMKIAVGWAESEGWNPGLYDADTFYNTDPEGFFIGELEGEIIACKSAVRYGNEFGFMGFYIVKDGFRGKGYGLPIWKHGFNRLTGLLSGMDGVLQQQENYMKSGYVFHYRQMRFEGVGLKGVSSPGVIDISGVPFPALHAYDTSIFPADRSRFLQMWVSQKGSVGKAVYDGNKICGYGVVRPCIKGFKIGPLFADDFQTAESIFLSLLETVDGKEVYLDVPEVNEGAKEIIKKYDMKYVFECGRMYNNGEPKNTPDKVFGVTTFELG